MGRNAWLVLNLKKKCEAFLGILYIFLDSKVTSDLNESYEVTKKLLSKFSSFVLLWRLFARLLNLRFFTSGFERRTHH